MFFSYTCEVPAHSSFPRKALCKHREVGTKVLLLFAQAELSFADASGVLLE